MKFSKEELAGVATRLRDLPAKEMAKKHSKQDAVLLLSREIADLKKRGYTLEQIAGALSVSGLPISTPTLKNYLHRAGRSVGKSRGTATVHARRAERKQAGRARASFAPTPDSDEI
jgi:hypothetical protein